MKIVVNVISNDHLGAKEPVASLEVITPLGEVTMNFGPINIHGTDKWIKGVKITPIFKEDSFL